MGHRIPQVNELIKQELGKILFEEIEERPGTLLTITEVSTSDDLINAKILVSVYPATKSKAVFEELNRKVGWLQHLLNKKLHMHPVPKIRFALDERLAEADRVERLIQDTKNHE